MIVVKPLTQGYVELTIGGQCFIFNSGNKWNFSFNFPTTQPNTAITIEGYDYLNLQGQVLLIHCTDYKYWYYCRIIVVMNYN